MKTAFYGNLLIGKGRANYNMNDEVSSFSATLHGSYNFNRLQVFYGGSIVAGKYDVNRVFNGRGFFLNRSLDTTIINSNSGKRNYFASGAFSGLNYAKTTRWGEWRIIGAEMTWHKESGGYYDFRKMLPDSSANFIERRNDFLTIGVNTDFVWKIEDGSVGLKLGIVLSPRSGIGYNEDGNPEEFSSGYLSQTIHLQKKKMTGFLQFSFGGYATLVFLGASYRLTK